MVVLTVTDDFGGEIFLHQSNIYSEAIGHGSVPFQSSGYGGFKCPLA